jgi:hypothetical protein
MGELQERITSTKNGSMTSFQAAYIPADDVTSLAGQYICPFGFNPSFRSKGRSIGIISDG